MSALNQPTNLRHQALAEVMLHRNQRFNWNTLRAKYQSLPFYDSGKYLLTIALLNDLDKRPPTAEQVAGRQSSNAQTRDGIHRWVDKGYITIIGKWPRRYGLTDSGRQLWEDFLALTIKDLQNRDKYIALFS